MSEDTFIISQYDAFENALAHYGTPRNSGRYPWGSGENAYQRHKGFLNYVDDLKKQGMSDAEIAKGMGLQSSTELRALKTIAVTAKRQADISQAQRLKDKGMSNVAIGEQMGIRESSVRSLLNPMLSERADILGQTASVLKDKIGTDGVIDIGAGVENYLGISNSKKKVAIAMLKEEGYNVFWVPNEQLGTGKITNTMVLAAPGMTFPDIMRKKEAGEIGLPFAYSEDGGRSFEKIGPPVSIDSKRVGVRWGDEGGASKDGVIELRRGVDDISLGNAKYAQVRIAVDGTHYIKGMAMYSDNLPAGVDMVFNTNKPKTANKLDALKGLKDDPEMPFGSLVRQKTYIDKDGKQKVSPLNIVGDNEEGRWHEWSRTLSSQMLSKQSPSLAKNQLDLTYRIKKDEFDEIVSLTNPAVKKKLLEEFADGADAASVHLKAAGLPRTRAQVILPVNSLKDTEVYAPNFKNGEKVVLIRHPHGGIFEIPELTVNNRNKEALSVLRQAKDAVGINAKVAQRLSGADFDGDTVLVIPNDSKKVKTSAPLAKLKDFDPQSSYPPYDGMKTIDGGTYNAKSGKVEYGPKGPSSMKQRQMGEVSNLITDMTIQRASHDEIARAVRHSMVVIDAEKHKLNYKQSVQDNGIAELKTKYQGGPRAGAATLISRAKSTERVPERVARKAKDGGAIDRETGEKMYEYTNASYTQSKVNKRTGETTEKTILKTVKSTKMAEAKDAHSLSSGTQMEAIYANHANRLKALANQARKDSLTVKNTPVSSSAREAYKNEVDSLKSKLNTAQKNAPLERQAQLIAKTTVSAKRQANPDMDSDTLKKVKAKALEDARARVGAGKKTVKFSPREWEAVQAGAISTNTLTNLLKNADMDQVKQLATPRERTVMTEAKVRRAQAMMASGYTQAEVADALGVPTSTLHDAI